MNSCRNSARHHPCEAVAQQAHDFDLRVARTDFDLDDAAGLAERVSLSDDSRVPHAGLAFFVGISSAIALRILGVAPGLPLAPFRKLYPVMWLGFFFNAVSGVLLLIIEPTKFLTMVDFYIKLARHRRRRLLQSTGCI